MSGDEDESAAVGHPQDKGAASAEVAASAAAEAAAAEPVELELTTDAEPSAHSSSNEDGADGAGEKLGGDSTASPAGGVPKAGRDEGEPPTFVFVESESMQEFAIKSGQVNMTGVVDQFVAEREKDLVEYFRSDLPPRARVRSVQPSNSYRQLQRCPSHAQQWMRCHSFVLTSATPRPAWQERLSHK